MNKFHQEEKKNHIKIKHKMSLIITLKKEIKDYK